MSSPFSVGNSTFLTNLESIPTSITYDPNTATGFTDYATSGIENSPIIGMSGSVDAETAFNNILASMNATATNPATKVSFPRTWDAFVTAILGPTANPTSNPMYQGFLNEYNEILQETGASGDLSDITGFNDSTQFQAAFTQFLQTYQFASVTNAQGLPAPGDGAVGDLQTFLSNWRQFMTVTSLVKTSSTQTAGYQNVTSYTQIYKAFFPNATASSFASTLNAFVTATEANTSSNPNGYFLPSQYVEQFYTYVQNMYLSTSQVQGASSILGTDSSKVLVINNLFALIISMIGTLQQVATVEANRLTFLTNYQAAYSNILNSIPVFTSDDGSPFGSNSDARSDLNPKNQAFTANMQSFQNILSDQAKGLQSTVDNENQAVQQQGDLATSILQEMSTLLQSVIQNA